MADIRTAKKLAGLFKRKKEIEIELAAVGAEIKEIREAVRDYFIRHEMQTFSSDGITMYVHRQIWANHNGDKQATCDALKDAGYNDLVTEGFHSGKLSSTIRELLASSDQDDQLADPMERFGKLFPALAPHIKISEVVDLKPRTK